MIFELYYFYALVPESYIAQMIGLTLIAFFFSWIYITPNVIDFAQINSNSVVVWMKVSSHVVLFHWCATWMNLREWRTALARRGPVPLDLRNAIETYPEVASTCCKKQCYGILFLYLALKIPTARNVFLKCWKDEGHGTAIGVLFRTFSAFAAAMSREQVDAETRQIGGPLYAHGWLMVLRHLHVIGDAGNGEILHLGTGRTRMRLQGSSEEAEQAIRAWLNMHPSVFSVILLQAPGTLQEWHVRACILYEACKFFQVPGMAAGEKSYSCQWLVRTFLVSLMRSQKVTCLEVGAGSGLCKLTGPDQGGLVEKIAGMCRQDTIKGLFAHLQYDGPPELFTMHLCLIGAGGGVKRKHVTTANPLDLMGDRFLCAGRMFQTRAVFLRDTCGVTSQRQPAYGIISRAEFDKDNVLVFFNTSKFYIQRLSSDVREGKVDVGKRGMAALWSSVDRATRRALDETALYAYDVNAMQTLLTNIKVR